MEIKASIDNYALLRNGKVPVIGYTTDKKRYTKDGSCNIQTVVCFHYDTSHKDLFYFENNRLVYQSVSFETPAYLTDVYSVSTQTDKITAEEFIAKITAEFVFTQLGF